jgi:hypothetical protein
VTEHDHGIARQLLIGTEAGRCEMRQWIELEQAAQHCDQRVPSEVTPAQMRALVGQDETPLQRCVAASEISWQDELRP